MEPSGRSRRSGDSLSRAVLTGVALSALLGFGSALPAMANTAVPPASAPSDVTFQDALIAHERGDFDMALISAKAAGTAGDVEAQLLAGHILRKGLAGRIQKTDAANWYRKAAMANNTDAMVALGELGFASEGGLSPQDAVTWWTQAAQAGRTDAMRALAQMFLKGTGIAPNAAEGLGWLRLAADQGDALAAREMGDIKIDSAPKTALKFYEKAAAAGDAQAAYSAAIMYAENLSIRPNSRASARLMAQAAHAGHAAAMADYGLLVYQGLAEGSAQNAADWFEKSARAGDDQGKFFWAYSLAKGDGTPQDFEAAYFWIVQTDKSGIPDYDKDIDILRKGLEANVDPAILAKAKARAGK